MVTKTDDFVLFLEECGLTQDDMDKATPSLRYLSMIGDNGMFRIDASLIQGQGVFSERNFRANTIIGWGFYDQWTALGRFINHSPEPNCVPVLLPDKFGRRPKRGFDFVTKRSVARDEEFTCNYRDVRAMLLQLEAGAKASVSG